MPRPCNRKKYRRNTPTRRKVKDKQRREYNIHQHAAERVLERIGVRLKELRGIVFCGAYRALCIQDNSRIVCFSDFLGLDIYFVVNKDRNKIITVLTQEMVESKYPHLFYDGYLINRECKVPLEERLYKWELFWFVGGKTKLLTEEKKKEFRKQIIGIDMYQFRVRLKSNRTFLSKKFRDEWGSYKAKKIKAFKKALVRRYNGLES